MLETLELLENSVKLSKVKKLFILSNLTNYYVHLIIKYNFPSKQSFKKSRSHGRAIAQNFYNFAQNLEICMRKL